METRKINISSNVSSNVRIDIIPGHFATNHSHVNYYVDLTRIKTNHRSAKDAGKVLADSLISRPIDTIICLEGTEIIGAFLANYLSEFGASINSGKDINVLTPEMNMNNQMIFRDNMQSAVENKCVLLLMSSVSTGKTIRRSVDCLKYYGGKLSGVAAIFTAVDNVDGIEIKAIFGQEDMPEYHTELPHECTMCKSGSKVEAIINSYGYSKL